MKYIFLFLFVFLLASFEVVAQKITTIKGYAPEYVGKTIYVYGYQDLLSLEEEQLAVSEVQADSTFSLSFENPIVQKVVIRSDNNYSYLYAQPDKTHHLYLPLHDADKPYRPLGNYVTSIFYDMDSTDINDRIVKFNDAMDKFYASNLYYFVRNKQHFLDQFKLFKDSVYQYIPEADTFFRVFVFYSFADADMSLYTGDRASKFIFDAYLDRRQVMYHHEAYFNVIRKLYDKVFSQLSMEINNKVYLAILKKSPSQIMKALEGDYKLGPSFDVKDGKITKTFSNEELRELVMIKGLSEVYYDKQYPKTNVIEILDSIANYPRFSANGKIAENIIKRLTWMSDGNASPDFALTNTNGKLLTLSSFKDKYVYFHIFQPTYSETADDIELLKAIYDRYSDIVDFVSIYPKTEEKIGKRNQKMIASIPWSKVQLDAQDSFFKKFRVQTYPFYILIDRTGMVIGAPALTPRPNGEYKTIDRMFYDIRKTDEAQKERERKQR